LNLSRVIRNLKCTRIHIKIIEIEGEINMKKRKSWSESQEAR